MEQQSLTQSGFPNLRPRDQSQYLKCPECAKTMLAYSCGRTVLYKCTSCHGLWFDSKRIRIFRDSLAKFNFENLEIMIEPPLSTAYVITNCPRCNLVLEEARYGYNTDVHVFHCTRCRGLWLSLRHLINLMQGLRTSQLIAPDVRGLLHEMGVMENELNRFRDIQRFCRWLCTPVMAFAARLLIP